MEAKHLKGELGLQFQSYAEAEHMKGRMPLGRVMLNIIAKRFFLDQTRGANLTQQSLLELDITQYSHDGLRSFVDRVRQMILGKSLGQLMNELPTLGMLPFAIPAAVAAGAADDSREELRPVDERVADAGDADSEDAEEEPFDRMQRLVKEFNGLVRADRIASGSKAPQTPTTIPATPHDAHDRMQLDPVPEYPPPDVVVEEEGFAGMPPEELPFSAGIPPGETDGRAMAAKAGAQVLWDDVFLESNRERNMARRCNSLPGRNVLFEYACSDDSIIGQVAAETKVKYIRLGRSLLDLCNADHVMQAMEQADTLVGWQPGEGTSELIEEIHHGANAYDLPVGSMGSFRRSESPYDQIAAQQAHVEIQQAMTRHGQGDMHAVLDEYCRPGTPTAHHELDGWVHTDAHDAFDLMNVKARSRSMASSEDDLAWHAWQTLVVESLLVQTGCATFIDDAAPAQIEDV
eukprot:s268_g23.t1